MEDAHICHTIDLKNNEKAYLFGVFDGHGGKEVAQYVKAEFKKVFESQPDFKEGNFDRALYKTFMKLDEDIGKEEYAIETGTTSCVVLITKDEIICANAGDSRAMLKSGDDVIGLSSDHKPDLPGETKRIEKANHYVGLNRVDANLALSRAIGDFCFKDQPQLSAKE